MAETLEVALLHAVERNARRVAVIAQGSTFRYADVAVMATTVTEALLAAAGPLETDKARPALALMVENGTHYIAALLAGLRLGYDVAPIDPRLGRDELRSILGSLRPESLFTRRNAAGVAAEWRQYPVSVTGIGDEELILARCPVRQAAGPVPARAAGPSLIFHTSGSSGMPKAVRHSTVSALSAVRTVQRLRTELIARAPLELPRLARAVSRAGPALIRQRSRMKVMTTFGFTGIGGHTLMAVCVLGGDTMVLPADRHPARLLAGIAEHRVSMLATTPGTLSLLLKVYDPRRHDVSSLCLVGLGGGPVDGTLVSSARDRLACEVVVSYGSTELGGSVLATRVGDRASPAARQADSASPGRAANVGRPLPGTEVRIVDEQGSVLPPGCPGELQCRPPNGSDWIRTGDLAVREASGDVKIHGRLDDMLLRDGRNIYPAEVECVLRAHHAVAQSAVIPVTGPAGDTRVCALIVPLPDTAPTALELIAHCQERLAAYQVPDEVRFTSVLPGTRDGEPRSPFLRRLAANGAG